MLACIVATGLFSSCQKEVVATTVTYELKGTSWKTILDSDATITASFTSKNYGILTISFEDVYKAYNFTYSIDNSYGILSYDDNNDWIGELIPTRAEIHLMDKNHISIGGRVFTKQ